MKWWKERKTCPEFSPSLPWKCEEWSRCVNLPGSIPLTSWSEALLLLLLVDVLPLSRLAGLEAKWKKTSRSHEAHTIADDTAPTTFWSQNALRQEIMHYWYRTSWTCLKVWILAGGKRWCPQAAQDSTLRKYTRQASRLAKEGTEKQNTCFELYQVYWWE